MNRPCVLLTGASGRLGTTLLRLAPEKWDLLPVSRKGDSGSRTCDLLRARDRLELLGKPFEMVVNTAAVSSTADCAADPIEALMVNSLWPALLAASCRERGVRMVHLSTDLVYSGGNPPYSADSPAVPLSLYGWSKLLGDLLVTSRNPDAMVVRTSVLCGETSSARSTFSQDVLEGRVRRVWVDSWRNHTPVEWLAGLLFHILEEGTPGTVLAYGANSRTRSAYAEALLRKRGMSSDHLIMEYSPPGVPRMLDLTGGRSTPDDIV